MPRRRPKIKDVEEKIKTVKEQKVSKYSPIQKRLAALGINDDIANEKLEEARKIIVELEQKLETEKKRAAAEKKKLEKRVDKLKEEVAGLKHEMDSLTRKRNLGKNPWDVHIDDIDLGDDHWANIGKKHVYIPTDAAKKFDGWFGDMVRRSLKKKSGVKEEKVIKAKDPYGEKRRESYKSLAKRIKSKEQEEAIKADRPRRRKVKVAKVKHRRR